jgi:hypothetical protein
MQHAMGETVRATVILVQLGILHPVSDLAVTEQTVAACRAINQEIFDGSPIGQNIRALASPITGGGISLSQAQQLFLVALESGAKFPEQWTHFAWSILAKESMSQQSFNARGTPLGARLLKKALVFQKLLPVLVGLDLLPGLVSHAHPAIGSTNIIHS